MQHVQESPANGLLSSVIITTISDFNSGALVRQRTIPTERLPLVGEVRDNFRR
jgi:hypothetical protein